MIPVPESGAGSPALPPLIQVAPRRSARPARGGPRAVHAGRTSARSWRSLRSVRGRFWLGPSPIRSRGGRPGKGLLQRWRGARIESPSFFPLGSFSPSPSVPFPSRERGNGGWPRGSRSAAPGQPAGSHTATGRLVDTSGRGRVVQRHGTGTDRGRCALHVYTPTRGHATGRPLGAPQAVVTPADREYSTTGRVYS
jgi:hypothetical protein